MFIGPDRRFVYTGYGNFAANTGANSVFINVTGDRRITFDDGQLVVLENCNVICVRTVGVFRRGHFRNAAASECWRTDVHGQEELDSRHDQLRHCGEQVNLRINLKAAGSLHGRHQGQGTSREQNLRLLHRIHRIRRQKILGHKGRGEVFDVEVGVVLAVRLEEPAGPVQTAGRQSGGGADQEGRAGRCSEI